MLGILTAALLCLATFIGCELALMGNRGKHPTE
jgi:hypothetical protein